MAMEVPMPPANQLPCCPDLSLDPICDVIDMRRHLSFPTSVRTEAGQRVSVDVVIHTRFTRCSGPLALGDPIYSTTLLPGEKVRLATSDRRSRFSFDSETKLSYRSEQVSEEQYRMSALRSFLSDANSTDRSDEHASEEGHWDFHGDASGSVNPFTLSAGGDTNARGSHSGSSSRDYLAEHRAHVETSDHQSVEATRKAHSVSVGEVSTRTHAQGESEDHFESSSREFSNANQCHALTFIFYRINKTETVTFSIESIDRRVIDPVAPLPVPGRPGLSAGAVSVVPQSVPATATARLDVEDRGYTSELKRLEFVRGAAARSLSTGVLLATEPAFTQVPGPLSDAVRQAALAEVDAQLVAAGLLDPETGQVSKGAAEEFDYTRTTSLPTAGVIVKGCLDDCNTCEPELQRERELDLEHKALENELLKRQIELLDKSQEYRCCPADEEETPNS
jgi:hypothetical protein